MKSAMSNRTFCSLTLRSVSSADALSSMSRWLNSIKFTPVPTALIIRRDWRMNSLYSSLTAGAGGGEVAFWRSSSVFKDSTCCFRALTSSCAGSLCPHPRHNVTVAILTFTRSLLGRFMPAPRLESRSYLDGKIVFSYRPKDHASGLSIITCQRINPTTERRVLGYNDKQCHKSADRPFPSSLRRESN